MLGLLRKKQVGSLFVGASDIILAQVTSKSATSPISLLSAANYDIGDQPDPALLTGGGRGNMRVAMVMPLKAFRLVKLTVPPMNREAVWKMLPYTLGKTLNQPASDYVYDWQVSQRFKDRQELTVYLYPADLFEQWKLQLAQRGRELTWFEPDVFAACNWISRQETSSEEDFLCILVWPHGLSIAVHTENRISMVRAIDLQRVEDEKPVPPGSDEFEALMAGAGETTVEGDEISLAAGNTGSQDKKEKKSDQTGFFQDDDMDEFLAGFGLQESERPDRVIPDEASEQALVLDSDSEDDVETVLDESQPHSSLGQYQSYLEDIHLEIVRTLDYHRSVLKGRAISKMYVGGPVELYPVLAAYLEENTELRVEEFGKTGFGLPCSPMISTLLMGAALR